MSSASSGVLPTAALIAAAQWALAQGPAGNSSVADDGELAFNNACRTCHTLREGDNRLGPNLHKVVGRKAGSVPGYGYSSAMTDAGMVWDKGTLDRFIANPDEVIPGHNMKPYGGIASAEERAKIVAYLEASGTGK
jgi:cytochrome c